MFFKFLFYSSSSACVATDRRTRIVFGIRYMSYWRAGLVGRTHVPVRPSSILYLLNRDRICAIPEQFIKGGNLHTDTGRVPFTYVHNRLNDIFSEARGTKINGVGRNNFYRQPAITRNGRQCSYNGHRINNEKKKHTFLIHLSVKRKTFWRRSADCPFDRVSRLFVHNLMMVDRVILFTSPSLLPRLILTRERC